MFISLIHPTMFLKGGAERVVIMFAKKLAERGHDVEIVSQGFHPDWYQIAMEFDIQLKFIHFPMTGVPFFLGIEILSKKMAMLIEPQADVIAPHNFPATLAAAESKKQNTALRNAPIVWYCEEPPGYYYDVELLRQSPPSHRLVFSISKTLYSRLDKYVVYYEVNEILANSNFTAKNIENVYLRKAKVSYLGTDIEKFRPYSHFSDYIANFKNGVDWLLISPVGRLIHPKNVLRIVYVAKMLKDKNYNFKILITGRGYLRNRLNRLIKYFNLQQNVIVIDEIPENLLPELYAIADVTVYPVINEPFGLVPLESMASETPVVVSDHGGPSETVINGVTGIHVNPYSVNSIFKGISILLDDKSLRKKLGKNGREHVLRNFTWDHAVNRYEKYIKETVGDV
jgi:glycosyltransferase involved in cell wall biosynthesis